MARPPMAVAGAVTADTASSGTEAAVTAIAVTVPLFESFASIHAVDGRGVVAVGNRRRPVGADDEVISPRRERLGNLTEAVPVYDWPGPSGLTCCWTPGRCPFLP